MAPKAAGGRGLATALAFVAELRAQGLSPQQVRERLLAAGYKKSRVSQLAPLRKRPAAAAEGAARRRRREAASGAPAAEAGADARAEV